MIATLMLSFLLLWDCPKDSATTCRVFHLAAAVEQNDDGQIILIYMPPGRRVVPQRRKTDWSRNIPIGINASDVLIVNGELMK